MEEIAKDSGLIELTPENIERLPEGPGVFQLVSSGQKVIYVDKAGEAGLRETIWELFEERVFPAALFMRYETVADSGAARARADELVKALRPPHNTGYTRFRNSDVSLPRQGHRVRQAVPNP